jgi:hypothetical protein
MITKCRLQLNITSMVREDEDEEIERIMFVIEMISWFAVSI